MLTEAQVAIAMDLYANRDLDMTVDQIGQVIGVEAAVARRLVGFDD